MSSNIPSPDACQGELIEKLLPDHTLLPEVTVVTVCFNPLKDGRMELFTKSLDSVQQQKGVTLEHLIVDGASSDGTLDFLRSYDNKSHDIRILSQADSGIYEAMNRGIALARGKYVIFLNSDDYYHRADGLALSLEMLEKSGCDFTFAPVLPKGPHTRFTHYHHPQRRLHKLFVTSVIPHPSMLYRRRALLEVGGYNQAYRIVADYDLTLRLVAAGHRGCFVDYCFATFVMGGISTQAATRGLETSEKTRVVRIIHREAFGTELTEEDAEFLVTRGWYPRKYLSVYVASQRVISQAFCGLPKGVGYQMVRRFNYAKYYIKSFLSF